jgi:ABC-type transporter Mla maintaining outer membrane lipid asymmetry ATPase subunit MlaF
MSDVFNWGEPFMTSLGFENATFAYEGAAPVFENLTLDLPLNKNILVTGPAGQGQSTLLKLMAVLLQPQSGKFLINGLNTTDMSFEEFQGLRRRIGYTFDLGGLMANRTLLDNLTLPLLYHKIETPERAEAIAREMGERFGFTPAINLRPASVSGAVRKIVSVARALLLKPELLLMDDPFTALDAKVAKELVLYLLELRSEGVVRHVFFTSREQVWSERLGSEPMCIEKGVVTFGGEGCPRNSNQSDDAGHADDSGKAA